MVLPLVVMVLVLWRCPESPRYESLSYVPPVIATSLIWDRWYVKKCRYQDAFKALCKLRKTELQAARDLFYIYCLIGAENQLDSVHSRFKELFTVDRNRRATFASLGLMFLQQKCGINIFIYVRRDTPIRLNRLLTCLQYSSEVLFHAINNHLISLSASIGVGFFNVLGAYPAYKRIDTSGRRVLLLSTFPPMMLFMLLTSIAFYLHNVVARTTLVLVSMVWPSQTIQ